MSSLVIASNSILTPDGEISGSVVIRDGRISAIIDETETEADVDYGDLTIIPGLIDTHVHVNEPGRTNWEGFETASRAAVKGGVTTILDMPLNCSPVTTSRDNFDVKLTQMTDQLYCQIGFHGGIVPDSIAQIHALAESGVFAFKIFTIHSGIDEFGFISPAQMEEIMREVASVNGILMVHAELEQEVVISGDPSEYTTYLSSRPRSWENNAINLIIETMRRTGCRVHIIHLSSADALEMLRSAKAEQLPLTVETCPHYLHFAAEDIKSGQTQFKCAPPIREQSNRELLWNAINQGIIDFIASDHSPSPPSLKMLDEGNFMKAWGGIASLQFGFATIWKEACTRSFSLQHVVSLMSSTPAKVFGLHSKGRIEVGLDADLVVVDLHKEFQVTQDAIEHRHKLTPYLGEVLKGEVVATYIRGQRVYDRETSEFKLPQDPLLFRKEL